MLTFMFELIDGIPQDTKQVFYAALIGFIIGYERELRGKPASIRTFSVITIGSCLFTLLSIKGAGSINGAPYDVTRIAAQIVSGVGFIGAGVIFKGRGGIEGITTAAFIWVSAAMGMACGFAMNELVFSSVLIVLFVHFLSEITYKILYYFRGKRSAED